MICSFSDRGGCELKKEARPWEVDLGVPTIKGEVVKGLVAVRLRRMKSKYLVFRMKS